MTIITYNSDKIGESTEIQTGTTPLPDCRAIGVIGPTVAWLRPHIRSGESGSVKTLKRGANYDAGESRSDRGIRAGKPLHWTTERWKGGSRASGRDFTVADSLRERGSEQGVEMSDKSWKAVFAHRRRPWGSSERPLEAGESVFRLPGDWGNL